MPVFLHAQLTWDSTQQTLTPDSQAGPDKAGLRFTCCSKHVVTWPPKSPWILKTHLHFTSRLRDSSRFHFSEIFGEGVSPLDDS